MNPYTRSVIIKFNDAEFVRDRIEDTTVGVNQKFHTVMPGETLQSIAVKYYGDSGKWFRIADANGIYNAFAEVESGMQLIIP